MSSDLFTLPPKTPACFKKVERIAAAVSSISGASHHDRCGPGNASAGA
jgi:hypothetical protein